jgi:23S rRNA (adenine2503-C2)-methyltransferase
MQRDIRSLDRDELTRLFQEWNQPAYRADQLLRWLHDRRAGAWREMSNLPATLRERLAARFGLAPLDLFRKQGARDTTQKFLWRLADGAFVESVLIPANPALYGAPSDRHTLCISTQVGCAYGCRFCASGLDGWKRNLTAAEIIDQVHAVERWNLVNAKTETRSVGHVPRLINNVVIMGMGEPLANYDNLLQAIRILNAPWGGNIGARKITVSTSGLASRITKLADDPLQLRLAISLHGATNPVRNRIMPVNRKYPLETLIAACEYYQRQKGRMITFEYILIEGVNDSPDQIPALAALARRLHAKVNLIPYNAVEGLPWRRPEEHVCNAFVDGLKNRGVPATLRREKGHDIDAACGQLRLRTEQELAGKP